MKNAKMNKVVLVDKNDCVLGLKEKFATHKIPVSCHRAISIVIFNKDKSEMLITKRAKTKPTWPSFWTNSVCSHPHPKESYQKAAERRIYEELGFKTPLKEIFDFIYEAKMEDGLWGEHELDHTFIGQYEGKINPNPKEIAGYEWVKIADLRRDVKKNPDKYSPWFKIILKKLKV
jgi:isopentenyl-diphosphate Delta-isomerase